MGKLRVVGDTERPGAGSTVLPGVPLPAWAQGNSGWAAESAGPRGASPLPLAWSVLPLPDTEPLPIENPSATSPIPAVAPKSDQDATPSDWRSRRIAFLRGRHRRSA